MKQSAMPEPLTHDVILKCSVAHAFETFTQRVDFWWPKRHRKFEASTLRHDTHAGGQLVERSANGEVFVIADVVACDPPQQVTLSWHPGKITEPTQTVVTFSASGPNETHVRVVHSEGNGGLGENWAHRAALFNKGWSAVLTAISAIINQEGQES